MLKSDDLGKIVSELKENNDNLEQSGQISKLIPQANLNQLINTFIFTMDEKKDFKAKNHEFKIQIAGKMDKEIANKYIIYFELELAEINSSQANCKLTLESNLNADLDCNLNVLSYQDIKTFSFINKEVKIRDSNIYLTLTDIDTIKLINSENFEEEDDNKTIDLLIKIGMYGGSVIGVFLLGVGFYCAIKRSRAKRRNYLPDSNLNNINQLNNMHSILQTSAGRVNDRIMKKRNKNKVDGARDNLKKKNLRKKK